MGELKSKTLQAFSWSFVDSIGLQIIRFAIGVILARLLFPEQFGLIGMLAIFMAISQAFLESGFGSALIQKQNVTERDICSVFFFNILVGAAAVAVLYALAPAVAAFYRQPFLIPLMRVLSLDILIQSFSLIQDTLFTKQINFKTKTKVNLIAGSISGGAGIALALTGAGVWSLVIQQLALTTTRTVLLWFYSAWRPTLTFSFQALREMFGYGSRMLASRLLNQGFDNIYHVFIGRFFAPADLGYFTRASALNDLPTKTLSEAVGRVTFPVFASIQNDPQHLKKILKKTMITLVLVNFPMMIGLAVVAHPLVVLLLTEKWVPCVPYLQLLCVGGLLYPLHLLNLNILQAVGRSDLFLKLEILKKFLVALNIAILGWWGITALLYGVILMSVFAYYLNSYYSKILVAYPFKEQFLDCLPYLGLAGIMGVTVYLAGSLPIPNPVARLLMQIILGVIVYFSLCRLTRLSVFMDIWQDVRKKAYNGIMG